MEQAEDELYLQSLEVAQGLTLFTQIDPYAADPPDDWVEHYGIEKAKRLLAAAKLGHIPRKDAPIGIQVAVDMAKSERRARSNIEAAPKTLNVSVVAMPKPSHNFKVIDVTEDED